MKNNENKGFCHLIKATGYSWCGLKTAWKNEAAIRQECLLLVILVPLGLWLGNTGIERALLVWSSLAVLLMELLNSAIEAAVDRIGPEQHPLAAAAKDLGSAAVFVAITAAIFVWIVILYDH